MKVRNLREKMSKYIYKQEIIGYHIGNPIWIIECDMINANKEASFLTKDNNFRSPGIIYREESLFGKIDEYCIFINIKNSFNNKTSIWNDMTQRVKNIIIDHELGHIIRSTEKYKFSSEEKADEYAIKRNGKLENYEIIQLANFAANFFEDSYELWINEYNKRFGK